jgi:hypothetical protein
MRNQIFSVVSTTALAGVAELCAASFVEKFSNRQTRGPGGRTENLACIRMAQSLFGGRSLEWGLIAGYSAMFMAIGPIRLSKYPFGRYQRKTNTGGK